MIREATHPARKLFQVHQHYSDKIHMKKKFFFFFVMISIYSLGLSGIAKKLFKVCIYAQVYVLKKKLLLGSFLGGKGEWLRIYTKFVCGGKQADQV